MPNTYAKCRLFSKRPVATPVLLNITENVTRGGKSRKKKQLSLPGVKTFHMYMFHKSKQLYLYTMRALPGFLKGPVQVRSLEANASTFCDESALVYDFYSIPKFKLDHEEFSSFKILFLYHLNTECYSI